MEQEPADRGAGKRVHTIEAHVLSTFAVNQVNVIH